MGAPLVQDLFDMIDSHLAEHLSSPIVGPSSSPAFPPLPPSPLLEPLSPLVEPFVEQSTVRIEEDIPRPSTRGTMFVDWDGTDTPIISYRNDGYFEQTEVEEPTQPVVAVAKPVVAIAEPVVYATEEVELLPRPKKPINLRIEHPISPQLSPGLSPGLSSGPYRDLREKREKKARSPRLEAYRTDSRVTSPQTEVRGRRSESRVISPQTEVRGRRAESRVISPQTSVRGRLSESRVTSPQTEIRGRRAESRVTSPQTEVRGRRAESRVTSPQTEVRGRRPEPATPHVKASRPGSRVPSSQKEGRGRRAESRVASPDETRGRQIQQATPRVNGSRASSRVNSPQIATPLVEASRTNSRVTSPQTEVRGRVGHASPPTSGYFPNEMERLPRIGKPTNLRAEFLRSESLTHSDPRQAVPDRRTDAFSPNHIQVLSHGPRPITHPGNTSPSSPCVDAHHRKDMRDKKHGNGKYFVKDGKYYVEGYDPDTRFEYAYDGNVIHIHRDPSRSSEESSSTSRYSDYYALDARQYSPSRPLRVMDPVLPNEDRRRNKVERFINKLMRKLEDLGLLKKLKGLDGKQARKNMARPYV